MGELGEMMFEDGDDMLQITPSVSVVLNVSDADNRNALRSMFSRMDPPYLNVTIGDVTILCPPDHWATVVANENFDHNSVASYNGYVLLDNGNVRTVNEILHPTNGHRLNVLYRIHMVNNVVHFAFLTSAVYNGTRYVTERVYRYNGDVDVNGRVSGVSVSFLNDGTARVTTRGREYSFTPVPVEA